MKRKVIYVLFAIAALYVLFCIAVFVMQDALVFPGAYFGDKTEAIQPPENVRVATLTSRLGNRFRIATGTPAGKPRAVLLFFLGNGADLRSGVWRAAGFAEYGCVTVIPEYPGYGESGGKPGVESIFAAAEASAVEAQRLAAAIGAPLIVGGQSLGTFAAVHLAAEGIGEKLLLVSPPTSAVASGSERYPFLPIRLLLRHRFDSLAVASQIHAPTLVLHGDADTVVPIRFGRELAAAIPGARFLELPETGHNNVDLRATGPLGPEIARLIRGQ